MRFDVLCGQAKTIGLLAAAILAAACDGSNPTQPPGGVGPPGTPEPPAATRIEAASVTGMAAMVGTLVSPVPVVRAVNDDGNPVADVVISFSAENGSSVRRTLVATNALGLATADSWTLGPVAGVQQLVAKLTGSNPVRFSATATPGPAAAMTPSGGTDQVARAGEVLPLSLVVRVVDRFGNPVASVPVTFEVTAGNGSIEGGEARTLVTGEAHSGPWTLGAEVGVQQVVARSGSAEVSFTAAAFGEPTGLKGRIAFVSTRDGNTEIYAIDADGGNLARLTHREGLDVGPQWSPDGSRIAFASDRDGTGDVFLMAPDGSSVTRRTSGLPEQNVAGQALTWAPDGSAIAFAARAFGQNGIVTARGDGTLTLLTDDPGFNAQPSWSPDGTQIAFVSDRDAYDFVFNIYTMNADGTGQTLTTPGLVFWPELAHFLHPAWSPDGRLIAFVYGRLINTLDVRFTVAVMSPGGTDITDLAWAGDLTWYDLLDPGALTWSPDGNGIAYTFVDCDLLASDSCTKRRSVRYVSLDRTRQGELVPDASAPSWRR